jgi:hypothetical protein
MSELPAAPEEVASPTQQVTIYALTDPNSTTVVTKC